MVSHSAVYLISLVLGFDRVYKILMHHNILYELFLRMASISES
jgi:hypothetical protein